MESPMESPSESQTPVLISMDIETTGPRKLKHGMFQLGAVAMIPGKNPIILSRFEIKMTVPLPLTWDENTVKDMLVKDPNWQSKMDEIILGKNIPSPKDGMQQFVDWVNKILVDHCQSNPDHLMFWLDFPSYDIAWIDHYLETYLDHDPIHLFFPHNFSMPFCLTSYAYGLSRKPHSTIWFSKDDAARETLGVPSELQPNVPHDHQAVHDAENMILQHNILLNHLPNENNKSETESNQSNEPELPEERKNCVKCGEEYVLLLHLCANCQKDDDDEEATNEKNSCHEMVGTGKKKYRCEKAAVEQYDFKYCRRHGSNHFNRRVEKNYPPAYEDY